VRLLGPGLHPTLARSIVTALFIAMLLAAVLAVSQSRRTVIVALSLALPAVSVKALGLPTDREGIAVADHLLGICFLGYTVVVLLRFLFTGDRVTLNTICASLCVWLLLCVLWASAYSLLDVLEPGAFAFSLPRTPPAARCAWAAGSRSSRCITVS